MSNIIKQPPGDVLITNKTYDPSHALYVYVMPFTSNAVVLRIEIFNASS